MQRFEVLAQGSEDDCCPSVAQPLQSCASERVSEKFQYRKLLWDLNLVRLPIPLLPHQWLFFEQALYGSKENVSGKGSWGFLRRVFLLLVSFPNQWEGRPTTTLSSIHFMRGESDPFPCS